MLDILIEQIESGEISLNDALSEDVLLSFERQELLDRFEDTEYDY